VGVGVGVGVGVRNSELSEKSSLEKAKKKKVFFCACGT
jgi:hypothetical protein